MPSTIDSDLSSDEEIQASYTPPSVRRRIGLLPEAMVPIDRRTPVQNESEMRERRRHWKFTYFGTDAMDCNLIYIEHAMNVQIANGSPIRINYAIWQVEISPSTDRFHVQGYIEFNNTVRPSFIRKLFKQGNKMWFQNRMQESREIAVAYCSKEDTRVAGPFQIGNYEATDISQGQRSDVRNVATIINEGGSLNDILQHDPNALMRMPNGIRTAMGVVAARDAPKQRDIKVVVLFGKPGSGKTSGVLGNEAEPIYTIESGMLQSGGSNLWWDGYTGENTVLFDDYHNWFDISELLKYLDRYTVRCQQKGSSILAHYGKMFITSNTPPWMWKNRTSKPIAHLHMGALHRRIHTIAETTATVTILHKRNGVILNRDVILNWIGSDGIETYEENQAIFKERFAAGN